jgi:hypothetical protein
VLLVLDLALRRETRTQQRCAHDVAETRFGEKQEVVGTAPPHDQRSDHPTFRREQQRFANVAGNVVRDHALEEILGLRACDAHVVACAPGRTLRDNCHRN